MNVPTLGDIYTARARIADVIRPTPLLRHALLTQHTGLDLWVKHENHNPTSAFKIRGGLNLIRSLSADERSRGVVTAITANPSRGPVNLRACAARCSCLTATTPRRTLPCGH
jgi:threonine dehydratase